MRLTVLAALHAGLALAALHAGTAPRASARLSSRRHVVMATPPKKGLTRDELFTQMQRSQQQPRRPPGRQQPGARPPAAAAAQPPPPPQQQPSVGSTLQLPPPHMLDGVPEPPASLASLADGQRLLVLVASVESAMSDRLRQLLVELQGVEDLAAMGAQVAAISKVPASSLRKLGRKAGVSFPLVSDQSAEWLGALGCASDGTPSIFVVGVPSMSVLGIFSAAAGEKPPALVSRVVEALPDVEASAAVAIEAASKAAAASALAAENEKLREQLAALAEQKEAAERERAKEEERVAAVAALEEQNRAAQAKLEAEAQAKADTAREREERKQRKQQEAQAAKAARPTPVAAEPKPKPKPEAAAPRVAKPSPRPEAAPAPAAREAAAAKAAAAKAAAPSAADEYDPSLIRNFCIIAHIDHGKSTLADRLLQSTGAVPDREMKEQLLDNMDLERERGITIKLQAARMSYTAKDGKTYQLNLIDTPGHVDFGYEVSRALAACEGALLVVDASQGVEAQTIANMQLALGGELAVVPVLNKIDLPGADLDATAQEIEATLDLDATDAIPCSAKVGTGVPEILEAIVTRIPPPPDLAALPLRALIFDSYYDAFRGVVVFIRVVDGALRKGDTIRFEATGFEYEVIEVGTLMGGAQRPAPQLRAGEVGYMHGAIKQVAHARVGDTISSVREAGKVEPLPGYKEPVPVVYCGLFPVETTQYQLLRESLERLSLNDAALTFEPESSSAMGFGFRTGFLGLLHMEIVQERLEREYGLDLIVTAPSVVYEVEMQDGTVVEVDSPAKMVDADKRLKVREPYAALEMFAPKEYSGVLMELAQSRRGEYVDLKFLNDRRCSIKYDIPLAEVITDFFDSMKSRSKGYASMEYTISGYRENDLVRLDVMINGEKALPLSAIVHKEDAHSTGKLLTSKLKDLIPRQQFKVPIQAAIGAKIVASSTISPMRKDVLAKCYGGDISRKKKLLNKQAKGKKRMKTMGKVKVPQEAFMAVLNLKGE